MINISNKILFAAIVVIVCFGGLFAPVMGKSCWFPTGKLTAEDGAANDWFGGGDWVAYGNAHSVGIDGDWVVVGAYKDDWGGKTDAGSATFYKKTAGEWQRKPYVTAESDADNQDWFGRSVAVDGNWAIIAAPDNHSTDNGAVYIFQLVNGNWVSNGKITASGYSGNSDRFGYAVALKGDYAIVGSPGVDITGKSNAGAAYILKLSNGNWSQTAILVPEYRYEDDYFGGCVGISSDASNAIIGAFKNDIRDNPDSGAAYIFHFDGSNWIEKSMLTGSEATHDDLFGTSVSIDGNWAIVGAQMEDGNYMYAGAAYIFHFDGSNWNPDSKLTPYDVDDEYWEFGLSVAINGDFAVVGMGGDRGGAYVYAKNPSEEWEFVTKVVTSLDCWTEAMGWSVALQANGICQAVAGAPAYGPSGNTNYTGAAYVFAGPSFSITAPNGGEELLADSNQVITWVRNCIASSVNIDLFNGSSWSNIATDVNDTGSWTWTGVDPNVNSESCRIRVSDADHPDIYDTSDAVFSVKDILVDSPDGGELIEAGSQYNMTWRTKKTGLPYLNFKYSTDGVNWKPVSTLTNDSNELWLVPFDASNQCLVKLSDPNHDASIYDTSDQVFTIEIPGDINHNGFVDFSDMAVFADNWLTGIP